MKELNESAKNYRKMKEKEREMCKIKVYVQHPASDNSIDCKVDCETREPLKEVVEKAYKVKTNFEHFVGRRHVRVLSN